MTAAGPAIDRRSFRRWVAELRRVDPGASALGAAAAAARAVAAHQGTAPPTGGPEAVPDLPVPVPTTWCRPALVGLVYEALTEPGDRRRRGAWFTPPAVVEVLVGLALDDGSTPRRTVDLACGGGAFLLGVAEALHRRSMPAGEVVRGLRGVDLDPGAVHVCRWSLALWAAAHGAPGADPVVATGDGLAADIGPPVDLVVGNPPFATPLRADRADTPAARYREAHPHLGPYADDAACFLDRAADVVAPGGRLVLVLPQSMLAGRDAAALRERFTPRSGWDLRRLWIADRPVFDAAVHVVAPVLQRRTEVTRPTPASTRDPATASMDRVAPSPGPRALDRLAPGDDLRRGGPVVLHRGDGTVVGVAPSAASWADAAALALGVPPTPAGRPGATLARLAAATSGFRAQHYGLAAACREAAAGPGGAPIVTVGQIDPLRWRRDRPVRFGGRRWEAPVVDVESLDQALAAWVVRQQRPKVLLATQSQVLEPLIDRTGELVPSTPVIAVHADPDDLSRVAAVLLAPPVVAWAARRSVGTALHPHAIKLAARQVLDIPLPVDGAAWDEAAGLLAPVTASEPADVEVLGAVAAVMCRAYQVADPGLWAWWRRRLPADLHRPLATAPVESSHDDGG